MWAIVLLLLQGTDYNAEGMKALEARNYEAAVRSFQQAIAADPKDYGAHFNLGLAYTFLEKDTEAAAEFRKTLELKPELYQANLNLGILLVRDRQPADAVPVLQQAIEAKPREFRPRLYYAEALLGAGDAGKAEEQYKAALEMDPKSAAAELGLAHAQARQNRVNDAAEHFRKAAALDPQYRDALLELAALYEKNGQPTSAVEIYRQFPENAAARERAGALLLENNKAAEAIPELERAVAQDPTEANRLALATAYLFNKQLDKALPLLEKSVAANPNSYDIRMMYGRALRDRKQYREAAQQFYAAVKLKQDSREAWNDLAGMLYLMESYAQALAAFDRVRQLGEDTPANSYFRAIILDKMQQLKPALEAYQHFLAMSNGKNPDEEFKARQRARIIQRELSKK